MRRRLAASPGLLAILGVVVALVSCTDDDAPLLPDLGPPRQAIRGQVRILGEGVPARIGLTGATGQGLVRIEANTDSDGRFRIPLLSGDYAVWVEVPGAPVGTTFWHTRSGPVLLSRRAGAVRVRPDSVSVADFDFGAIELRVVLPPDLMPDAESGEPRLAASLWSRDEGLMAGSVPPSALQMRGDTLVCRLAPLPAGLYSILLRWLSSGPDLWLPGTPNLQHADSFSVEIDSAATARMELSRQVGRLRGEVAGAWQRLDLDPPSVAAFDLDSNQVGRAVPSRSGVFVLTAVGADRVRLFVSFDSFGRWIGGEEFSTATDFPVAAGEVTVLPPIEDGGLRIRLAGAAEAERRAMAYRVLGEGGRVVAGGVRSLSGDYLSIAGLAPGRYQLCLEPERFGAESWIRQWYDRAATADQATWIQVPAGGRPVPLTVTLEPGGAIRGVVRGPSSGSPIDFAFALFRTDPDRCLGTHPITAERDGRYEIRGIPEGSYKLIFGPRLWTSEPCGATAPFGWIWYGQTAARDSARVITIRDHGTVEGIDVELPSRGPGRPFSRVPGL